MTHLHLIAIRDAEASYLDADLGEAAWLAYCARVRSRDQVGPAAEALADAGNRAVLCRAWGVDPAQWETRSGDWFREYDGIYCSAIETLVAERRRRA